MQFQGKHRYTKRRVIYRAGTGNEEDVSWRK